MGKFKIERHDVWKTRGWIRGEKIEGGNQGFTFLARKETDPPDEFNYILKELKHQVVPERRGMFCAEVLAMQSLDHPQVVRVADTNATDYREPVDLYLVTERIIGIDLEDLVGRGPLPIEDAARILLSTLRVVQHCHEVGVIHRDIKPCHVILCDGALDDPVLIDFGLAYHAESQPDEAATIAGHGKGNRFLVCPEHHAENPAANRNAVTDICQCVGLLFFAVSGTYPGILRDSDGRKPHERLCSELVPGAAEWKRKVLIHIFDVGFEWSPLRRWKDVEALAEQVHSLLSEVEPTNRQLDEQLSDILKNIDQSISVKMKTAAEMSRDLCVLIESVAAQIKNRVNEHLSVSWKRQLRHDRPTEGVVVHMSNPASPGHSKSVEFAFELGRNRTVQALIRPFNGHVTFMPSDQPIEIARFDFGALDSTDVLRPIVVKYLTQCIRESLDVPASE
jgi:serine/threonine protein kinase